MSKEASSPAEHPTASESSESATETGAAPAVGLETAPSSAPSSTPSLTPSSAPTSEPERSADAGGAGDSAGQGPELRQVSDPRMLRALAHPVRIALYELLSVHESLTATQASKQVGGSPTSVAYHLRTLAKYGFVEETEGGTGRERPWRAKFIGFSFDGGSDDPEANAASAALSNLLFKRWLERREAYRQHKDRWSDEVVEATGDWNTVLVGTVEEFTELQNQVAALFNKHVDRFRNPALRPEGSQFFELQLFTHPIDLGAYDLDETPGSAD